MIGKLYQDWGKPEPIVRVVVCAVCKKPFTKGHSPAIKKDRMLVHQDCVRP